MAPLTSAIDGVIVSGVDPRAGTSHLVYVSEGLGALLGRPVRELLGKAPDSLFADDTPAEQLDAVADLVSMGKQASVPMSLRRHDGSLVPVHATFLSVPSLSDGWPLYLSLFRVLAPHPVGPTASARAAHGSSIAFADHTALFDALAQPGTLDDIIITLGDRLDELIEGGRVVMALGYAQAGDATRFDLVRTDGLKVTQLDQMIRAVSSERDNPTESHRVLTASLPLGLAVEFQNAGVEAFWFTPIVGSDGRVVGSVIVAHADRAHPEPTEQQTLDVVARLAAVAMDRSNREADLAVRALHDPLTGLPNRDLMTDRLAQVIDWHRRPSLSEPAPVAAAILVDVDRFRTVNDRRGTQAGDAVLVGVASRLRSVLDAGDTIGRVGPDQFLVICPDLRDDSAVFAIADDLRRAVASPIEIDAEDDVDVTASVGVAVVHPEDDVTAAELLSNTESAVRAAQAAGRDQVWLFDPELGRQLAARHEVESALRRGIAEDELFLVYQPIIEVESGAMAGAEALIRWDRPDHGVLNPAAFIDVAEESGLIVDIGTWVIREACRQIADWPDRLAGGTPIISVNLSARQLAHPPLVDEVSDALEYYGVEPSCLGLEVTESMKVDDLERASAALVALADLGCHLSIDDFGIGYATLDYLRRFSMAHTLKVDRSFVDGLGENREDTAIVSASITLAESLGLTVVAEGVETHEQLDHLERLGCDYAQGYLLSKPVDLDEAHLLWHRTTLVPG